MYTFYRHTDKHCFTPSNPYRYCKLDASGKLLKEVGDASGIVNAFGELGRELIFWKLAGMYWVRITRMQFAAEAGLACVDYGDDSSDIFDPSAVEQEEYAPSTRHAMAGHGSEGMTAIISHPVIDLTPSTYKVVPVTEADRIDILAYMVEEGVSELRASAYLDNFFAAPVRLGWMIRHTRERTGVVLARWEEGAPDQVYIEYMRTSSTRMVYLALKTLKQRLTEEMQERGISLWRLTLQIPFIPVCKQGLQGSKAQTITLREWTAMIDQYAVQARQDEVKEQEQP